jgi:polygalacturonase
MNKILLTALATLSLPLILSAQDTRTVTEPVIPPVCTTLHAQLTAEKGIDPADETKLDTQRIQQGIDGCASGKALELARDSAHDAFLTGPIRLKAGVTLLVDKDVTLYGSRNPRDYDITPGSCGKVDKEKNGCYALITGDHASNAAIMGDGIIDGRGGDKLLVDGKSQHESWWDLANDARAGGRQQVPRLIVLDHCDNFTLYRITLKNSANFHVTYSHGDGFTVWGLRINTPANARNTDGVDPGASKNITVTHSFIRDGDDNIAIKGGSGPVTDMSVIHNHFYWGHGMSIGSETNAGVNHVLVSDLSLDGTTAGIRIKSNPSRGGLVSDITYNDICIRDSKDPISLTTDYTYAGKATDLYPVYQNIVLHNVRISGGGKIVLDGFNATHRIGITFDGVLLTDAISRYKFSAQHADITLGPGPVNFHMSGEDSTERGAPGARTLPSCSAMFVPFPTN